MITDWLAVVIFCPALVAGIYFGVLAYRNQHLRRLFLACSMGAIATSVTLDLFHWLAELIWQ